MLVTGNMPDFRYLVLLVALLVGGVPSRSSGSHKINGGTLPTQAVHSTPDGGIPADRLEPDAGAAVLPAANGVPDEGTSVLPSVCGWPDAGVYILPDYPKPDSGTLTFADSAGKEIHWPERARPIAVLEGSAVIAANAALQHLVARFAKERPNDCTLSAKGLDVMVSEQGGLYFVHINQRLERCGFKPLHPYASTFFDWFELYAVTPEGKVLARYPYCP